MIESATIILIYHIFVFFSGLSLAAMLSVWRPINRDRNITLQYCIPFPTSFTTSETTAVPTLPHYYVQ